MSRRFAWVVVAVIAAQFAVPAFVLFGRPPPQRFGFQMYSGYGLNIELLDVDGEPLDSDILREVLPASIRPELDWPTVLSERLCASTPDLSSVSVTVWGRAPDVVSCSR